MTKTVAFVVAVAVITYVIGWHLWGLLYGLGVHPYPGPQTPWTYQLLSGFIPALAIVSIFGGITGHFRAINCHVHRCWRTGRFPMAGGRFKVCQKHSDHPRKITHEYVLSKHQEHLDCLATASSASSPPALPSMSFSASSSPSPSTPASETGSTSPPPQARP